MHDEAVSKIYGPDTRRQPAAESKENHPDVDGEAQDESDGEELYQVAPTDTVAEEGADKAPAVSPCEMLLF